MLPPLRLTEGVLVSEGTGEGGGEDQGAMYGLTHPPQQADPSSSSWDPSWAVGISFVFSILMGK